jgi:hypothetical protein
MRVVGKQGSVVLYIPMLTDGVENGRYPEVEGKSIRGIVAS